MDGQPRDEEVEAAGGPIAQQRQRNSIPSFLLISFVLFMLTNRGGDDFIARHQYMDALNSLSFQLSNFSAWLNGTDSNFSVPEIDPSIPPLMQSFLLPSVELDPERSSYFPNITGFIHGDSKFHNITPYHLVNESSSNDPWIPHAKAFTGAENMTDIVERIGSWNWTASEKVALSLVEKVSSPSELYPFEDTGIALVHGRIEFTDVNTAEDLRLEFEGVHFISNGSIYGFAEPTGRHIDIRLLPSLVPDAHRNATAKIIAPELANRISKLKRLIDEGSIDSELVTNDELPKSACPFALFAQLTPVHIPKRFMTELEEETQKPTGIWTVDPPKLSVDGLLLSKECGIMYEIVNTTGLRSRTFFRKITTCELSFRWLTTLPMMIFPKIDAGTAAIAYFIALLFLIKQTELSSTPSGIARVSRYTMLSQVMIDSVSFAGHITFAILAEGRASLSLIVPAFLAAMLFAYETKFAILLYQVQLPEVTVAPPPPPPAVQPTQTDVQGDAAQPTQTVEAATQTSPQPQPSFFAASQSSLLPFLRFVAADPHARLWFSLFVFMAFLVRIILSPTLALFSVAITYSSIWLPQIIRSARRSRSSGLSTGYVLGTSACRLYIALYFLLCPKNVLEVEPRPWAYLLAAFVCLQVSVLFMQEHLGPTFFLPARYSKPNTYNYHPVLPLPDPEAPEQSLGDCAICMDAIQVDQVSRRRSEEKRDHSHGYNDTSSSWTKGTSTGLFSAVQRGVGSVTARKTYSLAPCHHLFHTECLERVSLVLVEFVRI
ncbi:hypothetical protein HGRIS_004036 [Hohenbuehelia grisea]|uniref:RING-type E3 ubiquitin transferase n=1 Tax=Hohenbuehelia grisea TaxID=104357 RepID=A0ABR3JI79_9AGAR